MGVKGVGLLLILLSHFCLPASPSSTHPSSTVPLQEKGIREGLADAKSRHQVIRHTIKTGHGHGTAGGGGAAVANPGESTTTPATQGGAAVIPVYAAGAANNNHHPNVHHSVASRNQQSLGPLNLCASVLATLVLQVYLVCEFEN